MERSAEGDDLIACPSCGRRDALLIRWVPEIDHRVHERTDVGCTRCELWRSAKEDKWAFADWNHWACGEWATHGHRVPHAELYRLLLIEAQQEMAERAAAGEVSTYLRENVAARCAWKPGDRFESLEWPKGVWSVRSVEAVYGTNTGPFCILTARAVLPSGILGDTTHEFWDHTAQLQRLLPFWKPRTWAQLIPGDHCLVEGLTAVLSSVDATAHRATATANGKELQISRLSSIQVPIARLENDA